MTNAVATAEERAVLQTLGGLRLGTFRRVKPLLLLAFVALEGPTPRRRLAELLWPGAQQPDSSLRVALHALRDRNAGALRSEDPVDSGLPCDAARLLTLSGPDVLAAYPGPFLHGVDLQGTSAEFEEWVLTQRERLARHVQAELLTDAERAEPARAAALAEQVFRLPGAPPPEPEMLRRLLPLSLPGSALETELRAEAQGFEDPEEGAATTPIRTRRMLGRAVELDALLAWATLPGGGVAAVSGPGGIGKSTLGRELLRELQALGRDVTHVDAEGALYGSELLSRLAAVRAPGHAAPTGWAAAGRVLGERPVVLLDGLDALEDLPELLHEVGRSLPDVRWVLTGRRRLGLPRGLAGPTPTTLESGTAALALRLGGLECPPPEAEAPEVQESPAVALFVREARRIQRGFAVAPANAALLSGLVRRLEGHPLALTLAASWLRVEPLEDVYVRILQSGATLHDVGSGKRGLAAVAERSWALLQASEQRALLRLSVFADFDPADALALGIPEADLNALLDHSFLEAHRPGSERLRIYPALESLVHTHGPVHAALLEEARGEHARHYLEWFGSRSPTDPAVAEESGNVLRAIRTALQAGTLEAGLLYHLMSHYDGLALAVTGTDVFQRLCDLIEDVQAPPEVQAAGQIACMWLAQRAGRLLDAQTLATRFLSGPLADDRGNRMRVLNTLAVVRSEQGQLRIAVSLTREALAIARDTKDLNRQAGYLTNLLGGLTRLGEFEEVLELLPEAQKLLPHGSSLTLGETLLWVQLEMPSPNYENILSEANVLLSRIQNTGNLFSKLQVLLYLGMAHLGIGQPRKTLICTRQITDLTRDHQYLDNTIHTMFLEAQALYALGRTPQARSRVQAGIKIALEQRNNNNMNIWKGLIICAEDLSNYFPDTINSYILQLCSNNEADASLKTRADKLKRDSHDKIEFNDLKDIAMHLIKLLQDLKT